MTQLLGWRVCLDKMGIDYARKNLEGDIRLYREYLTGIEERVGDERDENIRSNLIMVKDGLRKLIMLKEKKLESLGGNK